MKRIRNIFQIGFLLVLSVVLTGCSKDDIPADPEGWKDSELCHKLIGTSWQLYSVAHFDKNGNEISRDDQKINPDIIYTFTEDDYNQDDFTFPNPLIIEKYNPDTGRSSSGQWWIGTYMGKEAINVSKIEDSNFQDPSGQVISLTSDYMELRNYYNVNDYDNAAYYTTYYKAVEQPGHSGNWGDDDDDSGNSSNGNGGNNNGGNGGGTTNHHFPCKSCDESGDCWNCFGSGTDPITNRKCTLCHGSGKCQICHGKGYIIV